MECKKCNVEFEQKRKNQTFCSKKCRERYWSDNSYWNHREDRLKYIKREDVKNRQNELKKTSKYKNKRNETLKIRRKNDIRWKLIQNIKDRIRKDKNNIFKNINYSEEYLSIYLGYSIDDLIKQLFITEEYRILYLDSRLEIDHIIPYNRYIMIEVGDSEFKKCWNIRNLQLVSKKENISRNKKGFSWKEIIDRNLIDLLPKGADVIWNEHNNIIKNKSNERADN